MLGGDLAVLQAPMFDGLSLDPFTLFDDGWCPAEVGVGGRHIVQALVVALVVVVLDEGLDLRFEITGQEVVLQQDAVFQGLVPALDLALGLGMHRSAAHMAHLVGLDVFRQFTGDVAGAVIAEQPGFVQHRGAVTAGSREGEVQRVGDVLGSHIGAQLPGDYVAREVVEHGRQIHPAPPDDLEVGEVGLPHLVRSCGLRVELVSRLDHDIGRAGDQVVGLEQPVNRGFRHEVALLVGEAHGQLPGAQLRQFERQLDDLVVDVRRDAVSHPARR